MKKQNVKVGEIVLIPVDSDKFIPGKVLYLSKRYKDVILLALFEHQVIGFNMPENLPVEASTLLYTSQMAIINGRWKSVGQQPLKDQEKGKAQRIIGGSVWDEDQEIRPATDDDYKKLPKMQVVGAALVEKKALALVS